MEGGIKRCGAVPTPHRRGRLRLRKKVFALRREQSCQIKSAPGDAGKGLKSAEKVRPQRLTNKGLNSTKRSSLRGRSKVATVKWGLSGRGSNLL